MANATFGIKKAITQSGIIAPEVDIINDTTIKLIITNAGASNNIVMYGRIAGQSTWDVAGSIVGNGTAIIPVKMYDFVRLECITFSAITDRVNLVGSGFELVSGIPTITTPGGNLYDIDNLEFISSDSSVDITISGDKIDLKAVGAGGSSPATKYVKTIVLGDWNLSGSEYILSIPYSTHNISNPVVASYETNGSSYDLVLVDTAIDSSHNITIKTSQTPDTRFVGKIIIE